MAARVCVCVAGNKISTGADALSVYMYVVSRVSAGGERQHRHTHTAVHWECGERDDDDEDDDDSDGCVYVYVFLVAPASGRCDV